MVLVRDKIQVYSFLNLNHQRKSRDASIGTKKIMEVERVFIKKSSAFTRNHDIARNERKVVLQMKTPRVKGEPQHLLSVQKFWRICRDKSFRAHAEGIVFLTHGLRVASSIIA